MRDAGRRRISGRAAGARGASGLGIGLRVAIAAANTIPARVPHRLTIFAAIRRDRGTAKSCHDARARGKKQKVATGNLQTVLSTKIINLNPGYTTRFLKGLARICFLRLFFVFTGNQFTPRTPKTFS